ncbi:hypothetical protein B0I35DRAFT_447230, partial [Stachybotrys elegans]
SSRKAPSSPTLVDFEIRAAGGTTTAFDTMPHEIQMRKKPISVEKRIIELTQENGRLRREIEYYKTLVNEVLHPVVELLEFHANGLYSAVQKYNSVIQQENSQWKAHD